MIRDRIRRGERPRVTEALGQAVDDRLRFPFRSIPWPHAGKETGNPSTIVLASPSTSAPTLIDGGEQSRMAALGEIFMTLRSALEVKDPSLLADPGSPLTELAQAFDSWLKANLPGDDGKVSTKELRLARMVLVTKLRAFMRSRRGV